MIVESTRLAICNYCRLTEESNRRNVHNERYEKQKRIWK
jgi:hypothetical protein